MNNVTVNTVNTNANTNTNAADFQPILDIELRYDPALLTEREKTFIQQGWDGSAYLETTPAAVAVHSGEFHADDVLCVVLLKLFTGFSGEVVRTRDPRELERVDLRLDVGEGLLDHHGKRAEEGVAAVTRVRQLLDNSGAFKDLSKYAYNQLKQLVAEVAATDCGKLEPNWISRTVQAFNRHGVVTGRDHFSLMVEKVGEAVVCLVETWEAEAAAEAAALGDIAAAGDNPVVVFSAESRPARIKELLYAHAPRAIYYVSPENGGDWRILCAADPTQEFSFFGSRRLIPAKFRGLRGEALTEATGIAGGIFSHAAGFIAGFTTRESAEAFARLCLKD